MDILYLYTNYSICFLILKINSIFCINYENSNLNAVSFEIEGVSGEISNNESYIVANILFCSFDFTSTIKINNGVWAELAKLKTTKKVLRYLQLKNDTSNFSIAKQGFIFSRYAGMEVGDTMHIESIIILQ